MIDKNDKISGEDILELWKTTNYPIGVYIHSPFCKEQCSYCNFKGTMFNKVEWKKYYEKYLPKMIEFYGEILSSSQINGYFFGGGTPSLMSPNEMRNLFDVIPNFKFQKNKLMEMHVCDWNKEQLDVLKEYNFNIVIACIQTFDRDTLKKFKRRVPKSIDVVCEHIRYANSLGLKTNSDLLYLDTGNIARDIDRLMADMQILADNNISEITIQSLFDEEGHFDNIITAAAEIFLKKNLNYSIFNNFASGEMGIDVPMSYKTKNDGKTVRCVSLRIIKRDEDPKEIFHWMKQLDEINSIMPSNTLGIGSYKNYKDTFSTIEDFLEYVEVGDLEIPNFYVSYDKNDYKIKDMIDLFYEKLNNLMGEECPDCLNFQFNTRVVTTNAFSTNKQVKRQLQAQISIPQGMEDNYVMTNYIKKLETIWPEIKSFLKHSDLKK